MGPCWAAAVDMQLNAGSMNAQNESENFIWTKESIRVRMRGRMRNKSFSSVLCLEFVSRQTENSQRRDPLSSLAAQTSHHGQHCTGLSASVFLSQGTGRNTT